MMPDRRWTGTRPRRGRALRTAVATILAHALLVLPVFAAKPAEVQQRPAGGTVTARFLTIESPVTDETISVVRTTARELQTLAVAEHRRACLVLELSPGASQFHHVFGLADLLTSQPLAGLTTIAWVPETVTGPNVLIALCCDEIVMHPDAQLGDLGRGVALAAPQQAIVQGLVAKRTNPRVNEALALALMDPQATLLQLSVEVRPGEIEKRLVTEDDAQRLRASGAAIRDSRTLKEPGSPGLFSGAQARHEDVLIVQTALGRRELADAYGFAPESLRESPRPANADKSRPTLIEVQGMIDPLLGSFLKRQINRAVDAGSKTLIFEIMSPGGYLGESIDLASTIAELKAHGVRTVAYVPKEAISGAAIIALGCDEIYLAPDAKLGDAGPIEIGAGGVFERAPEKVLSYLRNEMSRLATLKNRPPALAIAMCDKDQQVFEVTHKTKGNIWYMSDDELHRAGDEWVKGREVPESRGNLLLTVNGQRASDLKLAQPPVKDFDELKERLGIPVDVTPIRAQRVWVDDLVFFLNQPRVVGILFFVAIVCLYLEMHMMTGALGLLAALCFGVFFWSKMLGGTAGALEILLFVFGAFCMVMELFFLPGVGVFGVTGVLSLAASLVLASQTFSIVDQGHHIEDATRTLGTLGLSIIAVGGVGLLINRYLPRIPFLKDMILAPPGAMSLDPHQPRLRPGLAEGHDPRLGRRGVTRSLLRPSGKAEIDGRLQEVVSDTGTIPAGRPIEVIEVTRNRLIVREVT